MLSLHAVVGDDLRLAHELVCHGRRRRLPPFQSPAGGAFRPLRLLLLSDGRTADRRRCRPDVDLHRYQRRIDSTHRRSSTLKHNDDSSLESSFLRVPLAPENLAQKLSLPNGQQNETSNTSSVWSMARGFIKTHSSPSNYWRAHFRRRHPQIPQRKLHYEFLFELQLGSM